jgi:hypothetical protein
MKQSVAVPPTGAACKLTVCEVQKGVKLVQLQAQMACWVVMEEMC